MTILKPEIETLDGLDKAHHPLYTEREGKFVFTGLEGYDPSEKGRLTKALDKERGNAQKFDNELKALRPWKVFADKKPEEIQAQLDEIEELRTAAGGKIDKAELEKMAAARAEAAAKPLQRKLTELTNQLTEAGEALKAEQTKVAEYQERDRQATIFAAVGEAAARIGANEKSYQKGGGLLALCQGALEVTEEGKVVSREGCGYPAGIGVEALIKEVLKVHDYFSAPSKGGGANPGNGSRGGGGPNPWDPKTTNFTKQMEEISANPERAKQLAAAHGVKLSI
jgi:hypothetical protein